MNRLPADVSRHVADLLTAREALALLFAGGRRGCNLTSAFREANTLRRVARAQQTDGALLAMGPRCGSLHEFVLAATSQPERLLAGVFRGAARGVAGAVARRRRAAPDPRRGRGVAARAMIQACGGSARDRADARGAVALGDDSSVKSLLLSLGIDNDRLLGAPISGCDIALVYDRVRIALGGPRPPGRDICDACLGHDGTQRRAAVLPRLRLHRLCGGVLRQAQQDARWPGARGAQEAATRRRRPPEMGSSAGL
ncbi:hypothetical protein JL721_8988 [Aureococcus anophagefferens]|nr:hypothetical protein JL721_8988 [Aureococcus anophagefferens]